MAIDDLDTLRTAMPGLFKDRHVPADWEEDWAFERVDGPERSPAFFEDCGDEQLVSDSRIAGTRGGFGGYEDVRIPDFGDVPFPGSAAPYDPHDSVPPPDCLGFYLPFHYFHPTWWGIYLIAEGVEGLGGFVEEFAQGELDRSESLRIAQMFIYSHEAFHHSVESFATRLEVVHRQPLYTTGFDHFYRKGLGTPDAIEEALACAYGWLRVEAHAFRRPDQPSKRRAALGALEGYIQRLPPGYSHGADFLWSAGFERERSEFAEDNLINALPETLHLNSAVWRSFAHGFHGISRVHSRVNYVVHRSSPLFQRIQTRGYHLRYRELSERLRKLGGCVSEGQGGNHEIWRPPAGRKFPVPRHPGDLRSGTLRQIIKQAGLNMSIEEFMTARV